jgi:anti-sigma28 factor (negative regulator of flagellin synthesis)
MINRVTNSVQTNVPPVGREGAAPNQRTEALASRAGQADAVELSEAARRQIEQGEATTIRSELVERVRAEIAAGEYLTDEKIDAVVDRLHEVMFAVA